MTKRSKKTFSQIVAEVRAQSESGRSSRTGAAIRGTFNLAGELFDPNGVRLQLAKSRITPKEAAELVRDGAALAFEGCGCGGGVGGCEIQWFDPAEIADAEPVSRPTFVEGYGSPTWIDVWSADDRHVVFAHGDVTWGTILS